MSPRKARARAALPTATVPLPPRPITVVETPEKDTGNVDPNTLSFIVYDDADGKRRRITVAEYHEKGLG